MNTLLKTSFLFLLTLFILRSVCALPTEQSLVEAWEQAQKADPKTKKFEKISSKHYRFATEHFAFDGEITLAEVSVDDSLKDLPDESGYILGTIEVDLPALPETKRYASRGYLLWAQGNSFYFTQKENRWLTSKEYFQKVRGKYSSCSTVSVWYSFLSWSSVFFLFLTLFLVFGRFPRAMKRIRESQALAQKAISISEDSNRVLKEILEVLRNRKE